MVSDTFTERVESELKTLSARDTELDAREARLAAQADEIKRERAEIRARSAEIARLVGLYRDVMGDEVEARPGGPGLFPDVPSISRPNGTTPPLGTTADMAAAIMAAHGGQMKIRDLLDALVDAGKMKQSDNSYGSLFGTLKRNKKRFVRVGPGEFALVAVTTGNGTADGGVRGGAR